MVFDAHSDLLYDVTRRRLLGERRGLEHHPPDRPRPGRLGLSLNHFCRRRRTN